MNKFSNKILTAISASLLAFLPQYSVAEEEAPESSESTSG